MKVIQSRAICDNGIMFRKILLLLFVIFSSFHFYAQESGNIKLSVEAGIMPLLRNSENLGFLLHVEPKIKVLDNTFMGMRIGLAINSHVFEVHDNAPYIINTEQNHAVLSFTPTIDYYFRKSYYRPYIGAGIGYHILADYVDVFRSTNASEGVIEGNVNKRIGLLLRGGVESDKLRLGLEYNIIPTGDIEILDGSVIGTVVNSYVGLTIGFTIIGGQRSE